MVSKSRVRLSLFLALCLVLCSWSFSFCFKRGFISPWSLQFVHGFWCLYWIAIVIFSGIIRFTFVNDDFNFTQETVYELSRSRKNGVSFKEKAKRTTTKKKTNRKKQKKSRTLGLEAIGRLCRHGRITYYSSKWNGKNGFVIVSQRINFHSFSFQIAVYLTLFVIVFW